MKKEKARAGALSDGCGSLSRRANVGHLEKTIRDSLLDKVALEK